MDISANKLQYKPIYKYLYKQYPLITAERIARNLMFISESEGQYCYKNKVTRGNVTVSSEGHMIHCAATAFRTITDYPTPPYKRKNVRLQTSRSKFL